VFKSGDVVVLKSGGPKMTVEGPAHKLRPDEPEKVKCAWFDGIEKKVAVFPVTALELAPSPSSRA
jgi:uncharacterized protein YodC (DUF2158 family)